MTKKWHTYQNKVFQMKNYPHPMIYLSITCIQTVVNHWDWVFRSTHWRHLSDLYTTTIFLLSYRKQESVYPFPFNQCPSVKKALLRVSQPCHKVWCHLFCIFFFSQKYIYIATKKKVWSVSDFIKSQGVKFKGE